MKILAQIGVALVGGVALAAEPEPLPSIDAPGVYALARMMLEDKEIKNVAAVPGMLEACAEAGYEPANILLLDVYEGDRKGIEAQPMKAFSLARQIAEQSPAPGESNDTRHMRAEAMYRLAQYCERGFGCKASPKEAYKWMRLAAMEGLRQAQVELSRYLMNGVGHKPEPRIALMNLRKLTRQAPETPGLYLYLGHMCLKGKGMSHPNLLMAKRFFERGAAMQDPRAINYLGFMYERGIGVKRDTAHALRLYRRAAELGDKDASANMQRLAYKTDTDQRPSTTWRQRVCSATLRIVLSMPPLSEAVKEWLAEPLKRTHPR